MYSLWKEVSDQIKKKAEDLNNTFQELNINNTSKDNGKNKDYKLNENDSDKALKGSIHEKLNLINNKYLNKDFYELQYYNNKFINGFNNIKKMVGDIYKDKLNNLNNLNNDDTDKKKLYLSKIVPWKKADIMISKIYRKKFEEGFPINLPDNNLNNEVYEKILKLNLDRNRILNTNILENYNFNWIKKKEQSEKIMQEDENLITTKSFLVPSYMSEMDFWKSYFFNIDIIYNEIADEIYENKKNILMSYDSEYPSSSLKSKPEYQKNDHLINENAVNNLKYEHIRNISENKNNLNSFKIEDKLNNMNEVNNTNNFRKENSLNFEDEINKQNFKIENDINNVKKKNNICKVNNDINIDSLSSLDKLSYSENRKIKEDCFNFNERDNNADITLKNNLKNNVKELRENNHISGKHVSTSVDEENYVKKAEINGLNIYMDNDIYLNLREKSNNFSKFLNNTDHYDKKEYTSFSSDEKKNYDNMLYENFIISEKNIEENVKKNENIPIKGKCDNISLNEKNNKMDSSLSISEYNLKLLEEIKQSNKKEYKNDDQNNSCGFLSSDIDSNEVKTNIYSTYEWNGKTSNDPNVNSQDKENNNILNFISCTNENIVIENHQHKEIKNDYKNTTKNEIENVVTSNNKDNVNMEIKSYDLNEKKGIKSEKEYEKSNKSTNKNMPEDVYRENKSFHNNMNDNKTFKEFKNNENCFESECIIIKNDINNFELKENSNTQSCNILNKINNINITANKNDDERKKSNTNMSKVNTLLINNQGLLNTNENHSNDKYFLKEYNDSMLPDNSFDASNNVINEKINVKQKELSINDNDITLIEPLKTENYLKEDFYFDNLNNSTNFRNIEETKENVNFNVDDLINLSANKGKYDSDNFLKSSDINIDEINFGDDLEFDFNSSKFNVEELEQFEKDLLNT
ncbi:BSD-domain protein, putative [Plasmodium relictum]|uniref:BSD-domain protein, putative n=1 Tax=Plasmodium relictum TaxID=85471 RepID=A0A1J1H3N6_PLARL|nr:BSD-domain protein, putative [Plasmodium relictum]CRG99360.1 BSD-domain protein, putative [Plasmodium relictum]